MDVAAGLRTLEMGTCGTDPVDGSIGANRDGRILFGERLRIGFRRSGIGTAGAAPLVDPETCEPGPKRHRRNARVALRGLIRMADRLAGIRGHTGRKAPSLVR